jgi:hypothetical protein
MVKKYTDNQLLDKVKSLPSFKGIPQNYWILGVRSSADLPDKFDDKFYLFNKEKFIMVTSGTTHPGVSILKKGYLRYNTLGAAVAVPQWYYTLWVYGLHKGKMPALLQLGSSISVYRDGNNNDKSEVTNIIQKGYFGINFHANSYDLKSTIIKEGIGGWSAGCQVVNDLVKYTKIIDTVKPQKNVTFCLIDEF